MKVSRGIPISALPPQCLKNNPQLLRKPAVRRDADAPCANTLPSSASRSTTSATLTPPKQTTGVSGGSFTLVISGQIMGGKNNMGITRNGKHYPKPAWARWRDDAVAQIRAQLPADWTPIESEINVRLEYVAGDKRRRDFPAIVDAIWHCLERGGFVRDDSLLWISESSRAGDKANPHATIYF